MDTTAIWQEVERVTSSNTFARSERMQKLLRHLVSEERAGRGARLRGYSIGVEVFDRPADFDASADSLVRVEIARLRRMLERVYADARQSSGVRIIVPKGRYSPTYQSAEAVVTELRPPPAGPALVVLPLEDLAGSNEPQIAAGLTAELLSQLSRFSELRVVDGSALAQVPPAELFVRVCHDYEAQFALRGRVLSTAPGIEFTVEVADATSSEVIWSRRFDTARDPRDVHSVQGDVVSGVAQALAQPAGVIVHAAQQHRGQRPPAEWDVLDGVLRWHFYRENQRGAREHAELRAFFTNVVNEHPRFATGWLALAHLALDEIMYGLNPLPALEPPLQRARTFAERARTLDPYHATCCYILGLCHYLSGDLEKFRAALMHGLDINPNNTDLLHHGGTFLCLAGFWAEGEELVARANMQYHASIAYRSIYVLKAYRQGNYQEADRLLAPVDTRNGWFIGAVLRALIDARLGRAASAVQALEYAAGLHPDLATDIESVLQRWRFEPELAQQMRADIERIRSYA